MQFTVKTEQENSLKFLHLHINRPSNHYEYKIDRKLTQKDTLIDVFTNQSFNAKLMYSLIHCLENVPMSEFKYNLDYNTIKTIAKNNEVTADKILAKRGKNI